MQPIIEIVAFICALETSYLSIREIFGNKIDLVEQTILTGGLGLALFVIVRFIIEWGA
ncbi:MAG: hypothetical protein IB616_03940 [Methanosarcinales archaeon]|nr:MAG: hypothetical protein IB616_03940 [Methanosarcinales archaeon]